MAVWTILGAPIGPTMFESFFSSSTDGNAQAGNRFHNKSQHGPLGKSRLKSENTVESPTGYRSRGPSLDRQRRKTARNINNEACRD
jgi:hypothetical protein